MELCSFEYERQGLRVTQPVSRTQRGSYLLSLPPSQAIYHLLAGAMLHWWLGVFLSLEVVYVHRVGDPKPWVEAAVRSASALGPFLPTALAWWQNSKMGIRAATAFAKTAWGFAVALAYIVMPLVLLGLPLLLHAVMLGYITGNLGARGDQLKGGGNSYTLSWACHPPDEEGDISGKKIWFRRVGGNNDHGPSQVEDGVAGDSAAGGVHQSAFTLETRVSLSTRHTSSEEEPSLLAVARDSEYERRGTADYRYTFTSR